MLNTITFLGMHINMQTLWGYLVVYTYEFKTRCSRKISEPPTPNNWTYARYSYLRKSPQKSNYAFQNALRTYQPGKERFVLRIFSHYDGFYLRGGAATRDGPHATEPWQCAAGAPSARPRPQPGTGRGCRGWKPLGAGGWGWVGHLPEGAIAPSPGTRRCRSFFPSPPPPQRRPWLPPPGWSALARCGGSRPDRTYFWGKSCF